MMSPHDRPHTQSPANRLAGETSPYLLQHAHNPVDWFPWGDEAFARARDQDKPVFLSVGYSACHWCHVMERESFENDEVAALLNKNFVSIKVDREERPDVDQIYMTAVQVLTQRGGWPMSVFMTPEKKPFYGGTYWPPTARMGMNGFREILTLIDDYWRNRRDEVNRSAASLTESVARMAALELGPGELSEEILRGAMRALLKVADLHEGGFGGAPKFPHPMDLRVLMRCARRFSNDESLSVVRRTLDKMAGGGIYDQLGGGFHRYSVDARWLVPHFEKMLYDNALLVPAYLEAFQIEKHADDARIVRETLDYVIREMTSPAGGFYSTQDADSEGEEGRFFVWSASEIRSLLSPDVARLVGEVYDVTDAGNWEGRTILNRPRSASEDARRLGLSEEDLEKRLAEARQTLFAHREQRIKPARDEKVLVAWNGLMITAFSQAARVLNQPEYASVAAKAADFLLAEMRTADGRLLHSWKDGRARFNAYLDDYAFLIEGLLELYQAAFEPKWLEEAARLAERMILDFSDPSGGFFYTANDHEELIARTRDFQDTATPSGNGVAATTLMRLGRLLGRDDFEQAGYQTLNAASQLLETMPRGVGQLLIALDFHLGPAPEVVVIDGSDRDEGDRLLAAVHQEFRPNALVVRGQADSPAGTILSGPLAGRTPLDGHAAAYVCERGLCREPCADVPSLLRQLSNGP